MIPASQPTVRISGSHLIHEAIEGEVIVVNLESGVYYDLTETGAEIWTLLCDNTTVETIVDTMAKRYGAARDAVSAAVARFLAQLAAGALVLVEGISAPPLLAAAGASAMSLPFALPSFRKFSDLVPLLTS